MIALIEHWMNRLSQKEHDCTDRTLDEETMHDCTDRTLDEETITKGA